MKPNDVVKISVLPCCARSRITRSASAPSGTFSTNAVLTLSPSALLHRQPAGVVLRRPAGVADRADVDEAHLQRLRLRRLRLLGRLRRLRPSAQPAQACRTRAQHGSGSDGGQQHQSPVHSGCSPGKVRKVDCKAAREFYARYCASPTSAIAATCDTARRSPCQTARCPYHDMMQSMAHALARALTTLVRPPRGFRVGWRHAKRLRCDVSDARGCARPVRCGDCTRCCASCAPIPTTPTCCARSSRCWRASRNAATCARTATSCASGIAGTRHGLPVLLPDRALAARALARCAASSTAATPSPTNRSPRCCPR